MCCTSSRRGLPTDLASIEWRPTEPGLTDTLPMSHGPTFIEPKGACIYCGAKGIRLTDEHIVPYSLGGFHVLREASCYICANVTKRFEQRVARDLWGDARVSFNAPSRRKEERPKHIYMVDATDTTNRVKVRAEEHPGGLVFYKMDRAGLLEGLPEDVDVSRSWQLVVIDDEKRRTAFLEQHKSRLTLKYRHVPQDFGRMLAKIGYGQVLTTLDPTDFRPICVPYILGNKANVSFVVGGGLKDQVPEQSSP
jgi:hypothetical protein